MAGSSPDMPSTPGRAGTGGRYSTTPYKGEGKGGNRGPGKRQRRSPQSARSRRDAASRSAVLEAAAESQAEVHARSLERWRMAESRNARRTLALAAGPAVLVALILVVSLLASLPIVIAIVLAALVVVFSLVVWFTASRAVLAKLQAAPADPVQHARLHNLVEGLCLASGLPKPALLVIDDPAANAISVGRTPADAAIVCTSGLLDLLDRMELEAVVAHELAHIRRRDTTSGCESAVIVGYPTLVVPSLRRALVRAAGAGREALADQAAISLTRYPPGLVAALAKVAAAPSIRPTCLTPSTVTMTGHLWLAPLDPELFADRPIRGALGLDDRIALLHEL